MIEDKHGNILLDNEDILKSWEEYIKDLYRDKNRDRKTIKFERHLTGEIILKNAVRIAMKSMKGGKAVGIDQMNARIIEQ